MKRIVSVVLAIMIVFVFGGCEPNNALVECKTNAKMELETYADEKGQDNYDADKWEQIQDIVEDGKIDIDLAIDKEQVEKAKLSAQKDIDKVPVKDILEKDPLEIFYTLWEAYDLGLITQEDLRDVANHHNNLNQYHESLSNEFVNSMKIAWLKKIRADGEDPLFNAAVEEIDFEDIDLVCYYGTYNNCIVVVFDYTFMAQFEIDDPVTIEIDGVQFHFGHSREFNEIWVCKYFGGYALAECKTNAKLELETYADGKWQDNYDADKWEQIQGIVKDSKKAIDLAINKEQVEQVKLSAQNAIDKVPVQEPLGIFYTLWDAYDLGLIAQEDLQKVAKYHNNLKQYKEALSDEFVNSMKIAWLKKIRADGKDPLFNVGVEEIDLEDIKLVCYYGTYNNCVVFIFDYTFMVRLGIHDPVTIEKDGVQFHFGHPREINSIWVFKY